MSQERPEAEEMLEPLDDEAMQVVAALAVLRAGLAGTEPPVPPENAVLVVSEDLWERLVVLVRPDQLEPLAQLVRLDLPGLPVPKVP